MRKKKKVRVLAVVLAAATFLSQLSPVPWNVLTANASGPDVYLFNVNKQDINGNYTEFPDAAFREYILGIEKDISERHGGGGKIAEDGYVTVDEWKLWPNEMDISQKGIENLTGIRYFTKLEELNLSGNKLTAVNLNQLTALKVLNASKNELTAITLNKCSKLTDADVSENKLTDLNIVSGELKTLNFAGNQIAYLPLLGYPALETLKGGKNALDALDITSNTALKNVEVPENEIKTLDLSKNTALQELDVSANELESIHLSANTNLNILDVSNNMLTALNVNNNTHLTTLKCEDNQIEALDVSSNTGLTALHVSNNSLPYITAYDQGSNLTEVMYGSQAVTALAAADGTSRKVVLGFPDAGSVIEGSITGAEEIVSYRASDQAFTFSGIISGFTYQYKLPKSPANPVMTVRAAMEGVAVNATNFPDAAFLSYVSSTHVDSDGSGYLSGQELGAVQAIALSGKGIRDLTGLEYFKNLESLDVSNNNLSSVSTTANTKLKELNVSGNSITNLGINKNTVLEEIDCSNNHIKTVNLINHKDLTKFAAAGNSLTEIDLEQNTKLKTLILNDNQLKYINVSKNLALETLNVSGNQLTSLNVWANRSLKSLLCGDNQLPYIEIANSGDSLINDVELGSQQTQGIPVGHGDGRYVDMQLGPYASLASVAPEYAGKVSILPEDNKTGKFYFTDLLSKFTYEYTLKGHSMMVTVEITEAPITAEVFPDTAFRGYVATFDLNNNGYFDGDEIKAVESIQATELETKIKDLTGIEKFTALKTLDVSGNSLTALDLTGNPALTAVKAGGNELTDGGLYGIEALTLTELYVNDNQLTILDISNNTALQKVDISGNQITEFQLDKNRSLTELYVNENQLTELNVAANTALLVLEAGDNALTEIDITRNTKLTEVSLRKNHLTALNISKNTALIRLDVSENELGTLGINEAFGRLSILKLSDNKISELDVTGLGELTVLDISGNSFIALDIQGNGQLKELYASNNELEILDVSMLTVLELLKCSNNKISELNISQSTGTLTTLWCDNNRLPFVTGVGVAATDLQLGKQNASGRASAKPGYEGVWEIKMPGMPQVQRDSVTNLDAAMVTFDMGSGCFFVEADLPVFSYQIKINDIPMDVDFSALALKIEEDAFPDDSFRTYVSGEAIDIDQNGYLNEEELEAVRNIDVKRLGIEDLTGIQNFTELVTLDCSFNDLAMLDTSSNRKLEILYVKNNKISKLDVSQNPALTQLYASDNGMLELNILGCSLLALLTCENNALTSLVVAGNTELAYLNCSNNQLETLDVTNLKQLTGLNCENNQLSALNITKNTRLEIIEAGNNQLTAINLSKNAALHKVQLAGNGLTGLLVGNNRLLAELNVSNNTLEELDLTANTQLTVLAVSGNRLTGLGLSTNTGLLRLTCTDNELEELDLTENEQLTVLDCSRNQLDGLEFAAVSMLKTLYADENQLTAIEVGGLVGLEILSVAGNNLEALDVSQNNELKELYCQKNDLMELDLSQHPDLQKLQCGGNFLRAILLSDQLAAGNRNIDFGTQRMVAAISRSDDETIWQIILGLDTKTRNQVVVKPEEGTYDLETDTLSFFRVKEKIPFTIVNNGYEMQVEAVDGDYEGLLPVVDAVVVIPGGSIQMQAGERKVLEAGINGSNYPDTGIIWSLAGQNSTATYLSELGVLTIGSNETAKTLTVTATSKEDSRVSEKVTVTVTALAAKVTGINISSAKAGAKTSQIYLARGIKQALYATVSGSNLTDTSVIWSLTGNKKSQTKISSSGILSLSASETASVITVTAASKLDKAKTASIKVYVRTNPPSKGKTITNKKCRYLITKAAKLSGSGYTIGTVTFTKFTDKKAKTLHIPDTIKVNGITYQVTAVKAKAVRNNKKLTTVNIGSNVKTIGKEAFYGCSRLKTLRISSKKLTAKTVASKAFGKTHKKIKVVTPSGKRKSYKRILKKVGLSTTAIYQ